MAYELTKDLTDEEKAVKAQEGFIQGSAPGGVLTPGGTNAVTPAAAPKTDAATPGANITDINKYLDVNREKIQKLGSNVSGVIRGDTEAARTGIAGAGEQFQKDVGAGTVNLNEDVFGRAKKALTDANYVAPKVAATPEVATAPTSTVIPSTPQTAGDFLGNAQDVEAFKKMYGAQYGGPKDLYSQSYYQPAAEATTKAVRSAGLVNTGTGLQELIARANQSDSGRYSKGALTLDQALLSGDPATIAAIKAAAGESDAQQKMDALKAMSAEQVLGGQTTSDATRAAMMKEFDITREEGELSTNAEKIKAEAEANYLAKQKELEAKYGAEGTETGRSAIAPEYFDINKASNIDKYNVATSQDYGRLAGLEQLTGQKGTMSPFASQAGGADKFLDPSGAFNMDKYLKDVEGVRTEVAKQKAAAAAYAKAQKDAADEARRAKQQAESQRNTILAGAAMGAAVGGPVGAVVGAAIGAVVGCFHPDTEVEMADGKFKFFKDIKVGDDIALGGIVYNTSTYRNILPIYAYDIDVLVTGEHAVFEDDKFVRVKDAMMAVKANVDCPVVHGLSCEKHRIKIFDTVFADCDEIDGGGRQAISNEESLELLNEELESK